MSDTRISRRLHKCQLALPILFLLVLPAFADARPLPRRGPDSAIPSPATGSTEPLGLAQDPEEPACRSAQFGGPTSDLYLHLALHLPGEDLSGNDLPVTIESDPVEGWRSMTDLRDRNVEVDLGTGPSSGDWSLSFKLLPAEASLGEGEIYEILRVGDLAIAHLEDGLRATDIVAGIEIDSAGDGLDAYGCNHVALVRQGDALSLYLNGVPTSVGGADDLAELAGRLQAGPYAGRLWDLRIYERALTDDEVDALAWKCADAPNPAFVDAPWPDEYPNFLCATYVCQWWADGAEVSQSSLLHYIQAQDMVFERHIFEARMHPPGQMCDYVADGAGRELQLSEGILQGFVRPFSLERPLDQQNGQHWLHENFHSFQGNLIRYQGFGGNKFLAESTASWGADFIIPAVHDTLLGYYTLHPHLPLWTIQDSPVDDSLGHEFKGGHQYGAHIFEGYLTRYVVDERLIGHVYTRRGVEPARAMHDYLAAAGHDMRKVFLDFAARTITWDVEHGDLYRASEEASLRRMQGAKPDAGSHDNKIAARYDAAGTGEGWVAVPPELQPGAWAYNAFEVAETDGQTYAVAFRPDAQGPAEIEFRATAVLVDAQTGDRSYHRLPVVASGEVARVEVEAGPGDRLLLVVATTPSTLFSGFERYAYDYRIHPLQPVEPKPLASLILMAGQSNMVGHGNTGTLSFLAPELQAARGDVFARAIIEPDRGLGPLQPGFGAGGRSFGVELRMGQVLGDTLPQDIYLFKAAKGGTTLDEPSEWRPAGFGGEDGNLYAQMIEGLGDFRASLEAEGVEHELAAFVWFQGYNDTFEGREPRYEQHLRDLLTALRRDLDQPDLPVIITQINDNRGAAGDVVMAAQAAVAAADARSSLVTTADQRPYYHYGPFSYLAIGERIAHALLPWLGRPAARPDEYHVAPGAMLSVDASDGLLANDLGDPATASVVDAPARGELMLEADGSFAFTAPAQVGPQWLSYRNVDAAGRQSNLGRARLWVRDATDDLVLHYDFDGPAEVAGVDAAAGMEARVVGEVDFGEPGRFGESARFEDAGYLDVLHEYPVPDFLQLAGGEDFSLSLWLRMDEAPAEERILASNKYFFRRGAGWALTTGNADQAATVYLAGYDHATHRESRVTLAAEGDLADGRWHHLAVVADFGAGRARLYVDGKLGDEADLSGLTGSLDQYETAIGDGSEGGDGGSNGFVGWIDDLRLYRRALDAADVAGLIDPPEGTPTAEPATPEPTVTETPIPTSDPGRPDAIYLPVLGLESGG